MAVAATATALNRVTVMSSERQSNVFPKQKDLVLADLMTQRLVSSAAREPEVAGEERAPSVQFGDLLPRQEHPKGSRAPRGARQQPLRRQGEDHLVRRGALDAEELGDRVLRRRDPVDFRVEVDVRQLLPLAMRDLGRRGPGPPWSWGRAPRIEVLFGATREGRGRSWIGCNLAEVLHILAASKLH